MIVLVKYKDRIMGSQTSVRAGDINTLKHEIFFIDNLKALIDKGFNSTPKIKKQFEYAESIYQAQCNGTLTEEMLTSFNFNTDLGGFECIQSANNPEEIESLISTVLSITADRRTVNKFVSQNVNKVVNLLNKAKSGETDEIISEINSIHHIL